MAVSRAGTSIELVRHGLTSAGGTPKTQRIEGGSLGEVQLTPLWTVSMEFVDQIGPSAFCGSQRPPGAGRVAPAFALVPYEVGLGSQGRSIPVRRPITGRNVVDEGAPTRRQLNPRLAVVDPVAVFWKYLPETDADDMGEALSQKTKMTRCLFVRHGVALHNCPQADGRRANVSDPRYTDSPLVRGGQQQAIRLGDSMRRRGILPKISDGMDIDSADASGENFEIDLVVCSPLTRCIQTAKCLVPTFFEADSNRKTGGESGSTDESMYASDGTPCVLLEKNADCFATMILERRSGCTTLINEVRSLG
ncbi:hypothetical protein THAOC_19942 [Thalassiosira oceanica]|uniref:Uncharacterized protein n=1 Tax=Thalassiosira oceanica TaxID=159749 RepID=K0S3K0_THAOC|nr:hypothetical protein THAOC_19942 [Thalassiosira oceanica]|eukprot:EJK59795.1 hypothetical protein THAOC_19942 [Thalassiosira oceanica]